LLMVLFVKPGHCNTFKYTNLIYSGQQCAQAGILMLCYPCTRSYKLESAFYKIPIRRSPRDP